MALLGALKSLNIYLHESIFSNIKLIIKEVKLFSESSMNEQYIALTDSAVLTGIFRMTKTGIVSEMIFTKSAILTRIWNALINICEYIHKFGLMLLRFKNCVLIKAVN